MRADAAARRAAIIREARHLFAAHGGGVALESIAEASGVGIATFYRNFASRHELADEVAVAILTDMREASDRAIDRITDDPEGAWSAYIDRLVELDLGALTEALADYVTHEHEGAVGTAQAHALAGVEELLAAARGAGLVRDDVTALELVLGMGLITRPQPEAVRDTVPDLTPRLVAVFVAGLRP